MENNTDVFDLFKPCYKRDKKLLDPRDCEDILDSNKIIKLYEDNKGRNGLGEFQVSGYTIIVRKLDQSEIDSMNSSIRRYLKSFPDSGQTIIEAPLYELSVKELPGFRILPGIIPAYVQICLVEEIIEELIPDLRHRNNLCLHYDMGKEGLHLFPEYRENKKRCQMRQNGIFKESNENKSQNIDMEPISMDDFAINPLQDLASTETPKAPMSIDLVRSKKLRWITLGGQYDWTSKIYPTFTRDSSGSSTPLENEASTVNHKYMFPDFPPKISTLFKSNLFGINPEAAIINFYSARDTLSPHQDVAEKCKAPLPSISIGCQCVFYAGLTRYSIKNDSNVKSPLQILLESGDVVIMSKDSRDAYHGVGRVWDETSPSYLTNIKQYEKITKEFNEERLFKWENYYSPWLSHKRVNINVRQMLE